MWSLRVAGIFIYLQIFLVSFAQETQNGELVVVLVEKDNNKHPPIFIHPESTLHHIGYPAMEVCFELFPEHLLRVQAHDYDNELNADVRFSITSPNSEFDINAATGIVYPKSGFALNTNFEPITIFITATDRAGANDGLSTTISLTVHPLTAKNYALLKYITPDMEDIGEVLEKLSAATGFELNLVKRAVLPSYLMGNGKNALQLAWIYGFKAGVPILCSELQDKIKELGTISETNLIVESFEDTGLASNFYQDNVDGDDTKSNYYIGIIVFLLTVDLGIVICYFWLRKGKCCFKRECKKPTTEPIIMLPVLSTCAPTCSYPVLDQHNLESCDYENKSKTLDSHTKCVNSLIDFQIADENRR